MADWVPNLFSKVILQRGVEAAPLLGTEVALEIDQAFKIGKSIAVLANQTIVGHLDKLATRVVWRHLRAGTKLRAEIYPGLGNWVNHSWYSIMSHSFEIGVKIQFCNLSREEGKLLLAHVSEHMLNSFPGVAPGNCPEDLRLLLRPVTDENGVSSLLLSPYRI